MTNELPSGVEETVFSFEKQIENLTEENERLKIKIKSLENDVELLKIKNDFNLSIIKKNNIKIDNKKNNKKYIKYHIENFIENFDNYNEHIIDDYENVIVKNKIVEKESHRLLNFNKYKNYINKQKEVRNNDEKLSNEFLYFKFNKYYYYPKEYLTKFKFVQYYKIEHYGNNGLLIEYKLSDNLPTSPVTPKNKRNVKSKNLRRPPENILESLLLKTPIILYKGIGTNEVLKFIASEHSAAIRYQNIIQSNINNKNITFDEIFEFKIKNKDNYQAKHILRRKLERCEYLHNTYGEKLNIFKFSMYNMSSMSEQNWPIWVNELDRLINIQFPNTIICPYILKSGPMKGIKCGKIDCKVKHSKTENGI